MARDRWNGRSGAAALRSGALALVLACLTSGSAAAQSARPGDPDFPPSHRHRHEEASSKASALAARAGARGTSTITIEPAGATIATVPQTPLDVGYYGLYLKLDPVAQTITGRTTIDARIGPNPLSQVQLDLDPAMQVDTVTVDGAAVAFTHPGDDLIVPLGGTRPAGAPLRIRVVYDGIPGPASGFHFDTHAGQPLLWTLSEPFGARTWWPCQDSPGDKADSVDVDAEVPSSLLVVSNGTLAGTTTNAGWTTYHWRERYPIVPYLVSIAAHPYVTLQTTYTKQGGGTMPITLWSWADQAGLAPNIVALTPQVLTRFATLFGEYPFVDEKYDMAQINFGGGMEHQTATSMCCWSQALTVHEAAHQWFGDAVTCQSFADIWLNEGFATYSEALWAEGTGGAPAYASNIWDNRFYGDGTIRVPPGVSSFGRIFDVNLSYNKPSWVLHMLRGMLGDAVFFDALRAYLVDPRFTYGTATTDGFRSVVEQVSGRDLANFFTRWIDGTYFPTYLYDWDAVPQGGGYRVDLRLEQIQTQGLYTLPLRVRVETTAGPRDFVLETSQAVHQFPLVVDAMPNSVSIDPDRWVLCTRERAIDSVSFTRGVLVVNGAPWTLGADLHAAYADSAFSGGYGFDFWDEFSEPAGGYVPQLPPPRGHGAVPRQVLAEYSTVIWVGDSDLDLWNDTSIVSYLRAGGNLLFLGRSGREFLHPARSSRLGLRWAESPLATLGAATAVHPALVPMPTLGQQTASAVFETTFDHPETVLLLTDPASFSVPRGIGAYRRPPAGGSMRPGGGHFAFLSGRPYRWDHGALRTNVRAILQELFDEPIAPTESLPPPLATRFLAPVPNPFNPSVRLGWELAAAARVRLRIHSLDGRLVRGLLDEERLAGRGAMDWDGRDAHGERCASGIYLARFEAGGFVQTTKLTLLR